MNETGALSIISLYGSATGLRGTRSGHTKSVYERCRGSHCRGVDSPAMPLVHVVSASSVSVCASMPG